MNIKINHKRGQIQNRPCPHWAPQHLLTIKYNALDTRSDPLCVFVPYSLLLVFGGRGGFGGFGTVGRLRKGANGLGGLGI
jgi:hypothetical protein